MNIWAQIDKLVSGVSGKRKNIIQYMDTALDDAEISNFCYDLGLLVSSFAFRNIILNKVSFVKKGEEPPTYRTRYINTNIEDNSYDETLHDLFLCFRKIQSDQFPQKFRKETGEPFLPDFLAHIPLTDSEDTRSRLAEEKEFREAYHCHYCTVGEVLLYSALWRLLSRMTYQGHGTIAKEHFADGVIKNDKLTGLEWKWLGVPLENIQGDSSSLFNNAKKIWSEHCFDTAKWTDELDFIGLSETSSSNWGWEPVTKFLEVLLKTQIDTKRQHLDLLEIISTNWDKIFSFLVDGNIPSTLQEGLIRLETCSRFPILPFHYWICTDRAPKSFCVSPVWYSQRYKDSFDDGVSRILGIAVSGVKPMSQIDFTIRDLPDWNSRYAVDIDPQKLFSFLRLIAKPLVECNLYHEVFQSLMKIKDTPEQLEKLQIKFSLISNSSNEKDDTELDHVNPKLSRIIKALQAETENESDDS